MEAGASLLGCARFVCLRLKHGEMSLVLIGVADTDKQKTR